MTNATTASATQQDRAETRQTTLIISLAMDAEIKRFQREDMRPTWNNAVVALIAEGLEARRRRKPLRPTLDDGGDKA